MKLKAKIYVGAVIACGLLALAAGLQSTRSQDPALFLAIAILAMVGSCMKATVAGTHGSMSMNLIFIILAITRLNLGETLFVGVVASLVQTFWHRKKQRAAITVFFNIALIAAVIATSWWIYHSRFLTGHFPSPIIRLCFISVIYFLLNTGAVAGVISITNEQKLLSTWRDAYAWSLPYYLLATSAAGIFNVVERSVGMDMALLVLPIAFLAYRSYCMRLESVEKSRLHAEHQHKHAEEVATLHLRTIRALALAIEAKDSTTGDHLHRVHTYALAVGRELDFSDDELQALSAASVLHDIGKIAVPEYIISKPAKLSREEFERMKIHPLVGGEIIESVRFPYPVAPIVRAHHEKWDGTGYPKGLKGEEIPVGARILSAVDCLDALASDRQYRRALPIHEAMAFLRSESGKAFDPVIVEILGRRYQELEGLVRSTLKPDGLQLSLTATIERGAAPDAGLEIGHLRNRRTKLQGSNVLDQMAGAFTEVQLVQPFDELLAVRRPVGALMELFTGQLHKAIAFDSIALFLKTGTSLSAEFVAGAEVEPCVRCLSRSAQVCQAGLRNIGFLC